MFLKKEKHGLVEKFLNQTPNKRFKGDINMKRTFFITILMISLTILVGCTTQDDFIEEPELEFCSDSDGGKEYSVKGIIEGKTVEGVEISSFDQCNENVLSEWYCEEEYVGGKVDYECPYGCDDGACLPLVEKCLSQAGFDCIDKASVIGDTIQVAFRNNIGSSITLNKIEDKFCQGHPQMAIGSGEYGNINVQEIPNNTPFRIKLDDCSFDDPVISDEIEITFTNEYTHLEHMVTAEILSEVQ